MKLLLKLAPHPRNSDILYPNGDQGIGWVFLAAIGLYFLYLFLWGKKK